MQLCTHITIINEIEIQLLQCDICFIMNCTHTVLRDTTNKLECHRDKKLDFQCPQCAPSERNEYDTPRCTRTTG
jgi:hypothetical protein